MNNEYNSPSKWTVAIVFSVIFLFIVGVFLWAFFFNRGVVVFNSDQSFEISVDGKSHNCSSGHCEISLVPELYHFQARSVGYYDLSFDLSIERFQELKKNLFFRLIPFLQSLSPDQLPDQTVSPYRFEQGYTRLVTGYGDEQRTIVSFESLIAPVIRVSEQRLILVDSGRVFFVDLDTGRKIRRFDDSVIVKDALPNDKGNRSLLFVELEGKEFLWLWYHDRDELTTLDWTVSPDMVQWEVGQDHRLYVISDKLVDTSHYEVIDDLLNSIDEKKRNPALYQVNLDTGQVQQINVFSERIPKSLIRRKERYFVEFEDSIYEELIIR